MADELGTDLSAVTGLNPSLALFSGKRIVAEAAVRRLTTPRGTLHYAPNYGTDVREALLARLDQRKLDDWRARIEAELLKDDRVWSVSVRLTFTPGNGRLKIEATGNLGTGPFRFTLAATALSVELLQVG